MIPRYKGLRHSLRTIALVLGLSLMGATAVQIVGMESASAHVGDITVTKAECVDATSMSATYKVGWTNGTATGKLYQRSGLYGTSGNAGSSTSGWTFVKNVSGASGSDTFTITHAKTSFSGGNGPWWSSKVIFSDGYGVAADTRVEGFDWNKCNVVAKDASASVSTTPPTCDVAEKLVLGQTTNATWGTPTRTTGPGSYSVTATATSGHAFGDGSSTKSFTGTLADKLDPNVVSSCRPPAPEPKVTHKSDDRMTCASGVEHREWDLESPPVWSNETRSWTWGTPVVKNDTGWQKTRDLTAAEKKQLNCDKPDKPEPVVKPLSGDRQTCEYAVQHRTGTETTDWVFDEDTWAWVKGAPVVQWNDWTFVRSLTPAEKKELGCDKPVQPEPSVERLEGDYMSCESGVQHRTGTKITYWVFDESTWTWIAGDPEVTWGAWETVRDLTAAEKQQLGCVGPPAPQPIVVKGGVKKLDKCGSNNFFFVREVAGLHYVLKGKAVREGVWIKTKSKKVTIKVVADSDKYQLVGKKRFVVKFPNNKPCGSSPHVSPNTGMRPMV